jgi:hypothetical protein
MNTLSFESQAPDQKKFLKKIVPIVKKVVKIAGKVNTITGKIITIASVL